MKSLLMITCCLVLFGCDQVQNTKAFDQKSNEAAFVSALEKHLQAVSTKDLETLKSTMAPNGQMKLMVPASELIDSVSGFMEYHEAWFKHPNWTFETKIVEKEVVGDLGIAIVESMYREPERDGKPYFNKMNISYLLKKMDSQWYVIHDHASSIEKSTD